MRAETARGAFVTVLKTGAQQAGALFVIQHTKGGEVHLFGPAPQSILSAQTAEREFEQIFCGEDEVQINEYLKKQENFDPDLWIIETQGGSGEISLILVP